MGDANTNGITTAIEIVIETAIPTTITSGTEKRRASETGVSRWVAGAAARISGPAKFVFDVTAAPSCTTDFVVTGISAGGAANQANLIALNRLYTNPAGTGFCAGTAPAVMFAYNVGAGQVPSLVALSLNGQKVAFSENDTGSGYFELSRFAVQDGRGQRHLGDCTSCAGNGQHGGRHKDRLGWRIHHGPVC